MLFDNTYLDDNSAKKLLEGNFKNQLKSILWLLMMVIFDGIKWFIEISFTDANKSKPIWKFNEGSNLITKIMSHYDSPNFRNHLPM